MTSTAKELYGTVVDTMLQNPDVTQSQKRGFGSGLRVGGKVFAMLVKSKLAVKLPPNSIEELLAKGEGELYESGGRPTKDWIVVESNSQERWLSLAQEAMEYVAAKS